MAQSTVTRWYSVCALNFNANNYYITKHIKIKGKITHFATNLLILQ
jgi:hypothetical protein